MAHRHITERSALMLGALLVIGQAVEAHAHSAQQPQAKGPPADVGQAVLHVVYQRRDDAATSDQGAARAGLEEQAGTEEQASPEAGDAEDQEEISGKGKVVDPGVAEALSEQRAELLAALARSAGAPVFGTEGEVLGEVAGILRDPETHDLRRVVVESGGFFGLFDDEIGIPVEMVEMRSDGTLTAEWSRSEVEQRPDISPDDDPYGRNLEWIPLD